MYPNSRQYRKKITVSAASATQTDFQKNITVSFVSGKMATDFSDLLFEDGAGNNIPYWVESYTSSSSASVWVLLPTTHTYQEQFIFMYYGASGSVSSASDIDSVMDNGLRAFLYDGTGFNTYYGTTIDTSVSHAWGSGTVSINGISIGSDTCSIKWQGWVLPYGTGNTVFYTTSDDGQRLYLNSSLVINNWVDQGDTERNYTYNLQGPTKYEYQWYENGGGATAKQGWDPVSGGKVYPIPSTYLRCRKYLSSEPSMTFGSEEESGDIDVGAYKASGGVVSYVDGRIIHTFYNSGNFVLGENITADYLIVAGGGGGGSFGGGGGGGGVLTDTNHSLSSGSYPITVGNGGQGQQTYNSGNPGANGGNSVFGTFTAIGGGGGGTRAGGGSVGHNGENGGSGGGGSPEDSGTKTIGGTATSGQGYDGGSSLEYGWGGGGGGGAGAVGGDTSGSSSSQVAGSGGAGIASSISGSSAYYAGGGGGCQYSGGTGAAGTGGIGGGGDGSRTGNGSNGQTGTGGGGGGSNAGAYVGGNGGSGIVIISYSASVYRPQIITLM